MQQAEKAALLRNLHHGPDILRIANAWDAASARIVERAGFPAIGTTSAGIAFSLGYPDGEVIPPGEMLGQVERIVRVSSVPVTADLEAAYDDVETVAADLIRTGAVGLNVEDSQHGALVDVALQVAKIRAIRAVADRMGVPLVINARADVYFDQTGDPEARWHLAMSRLLAYKEAGADCLFIPFLKDEPTIARFVDALRFPLNILSGEGSPSVSRLQELGVARVSLGSGPMRAALGLMRRIAEEFRDRGAYRAMLDGAISYADANALLR